MLTDVRATDGRRMPACTISSPYYSVTVMKQKIQSENKNENQPKTCNPNEQKNSKCCDSCQINRKNKKKIEMIQCCFCMSWCVGVGKDDPNEIWLCLSCRSVPENVQNEISSLKNDVNQLKITTELILSSVNKLSTRLENSIGGINDRITALT